MTGSGERRRHTRVRFRTRIDVVFDDGSSAAGLMSRDLSEGGFFVATDLVAEEGANLSFGLRPLPDGPIVRGRGTVAWVRAEDEGPESPAGMAVQILETDNGCAAGLRRVVGEADSESPQNHTVTAVIPVGAADKAEAAEEQTVVEVATPAPSRAAENREAVSRHEPDTGDREAEVPPEWQQTLPEHDAAVTEVFVLEGDHSPAAECDNAAALPAAGDRVGNGADMPDSGANEVEPLDLPAAPVADEPPRKRLPWWVGAAIVSMLIAVAVAAIVLVHGVGGPVAPGEEPVAGDETVSPVGPAALATTSPGNGSSDLAGAAFPGEAVGASPDLQADSDGPAIPTPRAATEILDVSWAHSEGVTSVKVRADGEIAPARVDGSMLTNPPRFLMRIRGIHVPYTPEVIVPGLGSPAHIRIGHHPELSPPQIYIVFDLAVGDGEVSWAIVGGDSIEISLVEPEPSR